MGNCASLPNIVTHTQKQSVSNESVECALYSTQGKRPRMEDRHTICLSLPKHPSYSLFGVFDGFNGDHASSYLSQHIVDTLDNITNLEDNGSIIDAIENLDAKYMSYDHSEANMYKKEAGCTFVFALTHKVFLNYASNYYLADNQHEICCCSVNESTAKNADDTQSLVVNYGYHVRVFWAGDSRAILMSDICKFHNLTEDHHCSSPKEAKRILGAKARIINQRIDGICEVTRCFGCHQMKNIDSLPLNKQKMISEPDCTTLLCRRNDRLLIFSDGLTKKWTDDQFKARCKHHVLQHEIEKEGSLMAMKYLSEQAIDEGSKDNITVLSVKFK